MEIQDGNQNKRPKIDLTTVSQDPDYQKYLDAKINSIMGERKTMPFEDLRKNNPSIFITPSKKETAEMFHIASMDGDPSSFSHDELEIFFTLKDSHQENGKLIIAPQNKYDHLDRSGLSDASEAEIEGLISNQESQNPKKDTYIKNYEESIKTTETVYEQQEKIQNPKFEGRNKPLEKKLASTNPDDAVKAINDDTMTDFVDPKTGKKVNIMDIPFGKFDEYRYKAFKNGTSDEKLCKKFEAETGVKISTMSSNNDASYSYYVGDYRVEYPARNDESQHIKIYNSKTGIYVSGRQIPWAPKNKDSVPSQNGSFFCIFKYENTKAGTSATFFQEEDKTPLWDYSRIFDKNGSIKPPTVRVQTIDDIHTFDYKPSKQAVDYSLYHFTPGE